MSRHRVPRCSLSESLQHWRMHARTHSGMRNGVSAICRTVEVQQSLLRLQLLSTHYGKLGSVFNQESLKIPELFRARRGCGASAYYLRSHLCRPLPPPTVTGAIKAAVSKQYWREFDSQTLTEDERQPAGQCKNTQTTNVKGCLQEAYLFWCN